MSSAEVAISEACVHNKAIVCHSGVKCQVLSARAAEPHEMLLLRSQKHLTKDLAKPSVLRAYLLLADLLAVCQLLLQF